MNGKPAATTSSTAPTRRPPSALGAGTASSIAKTKPLSSTLKQGVAPVAPSMKTDPKKAATHPAPGQKVVVVPSRYLTTKRTEDKTDTDPKPVVVRKTPAVTTSKDRLRLPLTTTTSTIPRIRPPSTNSSATPTPRPPTTTPKKTTHTTTSTLAPKPRPSTTTTKKPPSTLKHDTLLPDQHLKDDKSVTSDTPGDDGAVGGVIVNGIVEGNATSNATPSGDVVEELHSRIRELQGALSALTFERDSLQQQLAAEHSSVHDGDTGDAEEDFDESSVGSMESWDSEMTDERDDKYNELLRRYHGTLTLLKQRMVAFKGALSEAKSEYDSLSSKYSIVLTQNEQLHQELDLLRPLKPKTNASTVAVTS